MINEATYTETETVRVPGWVMPVFLGVVTAVVISEIPDSFDGTSLNVHNDVVNGESEAQNEGGEESSETDEGDTKPPEEMTDEELEERWSELQDDMFSPHSEEEAEVIVDEMNAIEDEIHSRRVRVING